MGGRDATTYKGQCPCARCFARIFLHRVGKIRIITVSGFVLRAGQPIRIALPKPFGI